MIRTTESSDDIQIFTALQELSACFRSWRNSHGFSGSYTAATTERGRTYEQMAGLVFSQFAREEVGFSLWEGRMQTSDGADGWSCIRDNQIRLFKKDRLRYEVDGLAFYKDMLVFTEVSLSRQPSYFRNLREKIPLKREALGKAFACDRVGCLVITRPGMRTIPYRSVRGTISLTLPFMKSYSVC